MKIVHSTRPLGLIGVGISTKYLILQCKHCEENKDMESGRKTTCLGFWEIIGSSHLEEWRSPVLHRLSLGRLLGIILS